MPPTHKTFTQEEVNGLIANDRRTLDRKYKDAIARLTQELADHKTVNDAAKARVTELEGQLAGVTGDRDTLRSEFEAASASHAETVAALEQRHTATVESHRRMSGEFAITQALTAARVIPEAMKIAAELMLRGSTLEQNERDDVTAVTYAGKRYASAAEAAKVFLEGHKFIALPPQVGGSGSPRYLTHHSPSPVDITKIDPAQLASEGWSEPH